MGESLMRKFYLLSKIKARIGNLNITLYVLATNLIINDIIGGTDGLTVSLPFVELNSFFMTQIMAMMATRKEKKYLIFLMLLWGL